MRFGGSALCGTSILLFWAGFLHIFPMATLVFDIETSALPLDSFDSSSQEYLMRPAARLATEEEQEAKREELVRMMNLWPFTARVVCVAMINAETLRGQVIFIADDFESNSRSVAGVEFVPVMDEEELIAQFWEVTKHYDKVVTFNGRQFDIPFLYLRSAQLDVPISKKNWLGYRFATDPHCDLAERINACAAPPAKKAKAPPTCWLPQSIKTKLGAIEDPGRQFAANIRATFGCGTTESLALARRERKARERKARARSAPG